MSARVATSVTVGQGAEEKRSRRVAENGDELPREKMDSGGARRLSMFFAFLITVGTSLNASGEKGGRRIL